MDGTVKVTAQQVARRARVSLGTVSRVLNDDPTVSPELSRRVRESVAALDYKRLRRRKQKSGSVHPIEGKTIGLLLIGMGDSLARLPVVTEAIDGIRHRISELGGRLEIVAAPDPGQEPRWLKTSRFDGWLIKGAMQGDLFGGSHPALVERWEQQPCVWFHGRPHGAPGSACSPNDWRIGELAAEHLAALGHRKVAFLSPKSDHLLLSKRQLGFAARCEALGVRCQVVSRNLENWTFPLERPRSLETMSELFVEMWERRAADRPTAAFTPADSMAVLFYQVLSKHGLQVGKDLSVISANHETVLTASLFPSLTTIDVCSFAIGRQAVDLLSSRLDQGPSDPSQNVLIDPALVVGESTVPLT